MTSRRLALDLVLEEFVRLFDAGDVDFSNSAEFGLRSDGFVDPSVDPTSEQYRAAVMEGWRRLTGRDRYLPEHDEVFDVDQDEHLAHPYPFSSRDPVEVGRYLGAIAGMLREWGLTPPARVLEMGAGWGLLSLTLAQTGFEVTAVDLNPGSVRLLRERAARNGVRMTVIESGFLEASLDEPYDAIVFFESFHHCDQPLVLLDRCIETLAPGGQLVFVAEAVYEGFYAPWGLRLDGSAIYAARKFGWLELGFDAAFFYRELLRRGLSLQWVEDPQLGPYGRYLYARRWPADRIEPGRSLLPADEERTWVAGRPGFAGRIATGRSLMTLPDAWTGSVEAQLVNLADVRLRAEIGTPGKSCTVVFEPGERRAVPLDLAERNGPLEIRSDLGPSQALGLDEVGVYLEALVRS